MLVLTRKENEDVLIGRHIRVQVLELHRGRAKLGIEAPRDVRIARGEKRKGERR